MIEKGVVASTSRGQLFVVLGNLSTQMGVQYKGWYGIGFNGVRVTDELPEFLAKNINAYLAQLGV